MPKKFICWIVSIRSPAAAAAALDDADDDNDDGSVVTESLDSEKDDSSGAPEFSGLSRILTTNGEVILNGNHVVC